MTDVPAGAWEYVTASLSRIEKAVQTHADEVKELRDLLIRLDERQAHNATKAELALVNAKVESAHARLDNFELDLNSQRDSAAKVAADLQGLRLSWAKAGGFGGIGAGVVVAVAKAFGVG